MEQHPTLPFQQWDVPNNSVDLIITDPPYPKQYQYLFNDLGAFAARVLKDKGSLITLCGHYQLPYVLNALSQYLKYRWVLCLWQGDGSHARMLMGVEVMWKPVLWFVKGAYPQGKGFIRDAIISPEGDKSLHKWQQNEAYYEYLISKSQFLPTGGVVCDPMAGSWTIGRVSERLGVKWVGCDIETRWDDFRKVERLDE